MELAVTTKDFILPMVNGKGQRIDVLDSSETYTLENRQTYILLLKQNEKEVFLPQFIPVLVGKEFVKQ